MKVSEYTIKNLAKIVCGDVEYMPYVSGPNLVYFFNRYGSNDTYEQGFPSRWKYTEDEIRRLNGKDEIRKIIEEVIDPRNFHNTQLDIDRAVSEINEILKFDKFTLVKNGEFYKVTSTTNNVIEPETSNKINHEFINEQIFKCKRKIMEEDYDGAITNARSMVEAIFIEIIERGSSSEIKNDGDINNLWKKVKKTMKIEIDPQTMPEYVIQTLTGIETSIKGLSGISNNAGDRHAIKFRTKKHHAKLAVNLAMTLSDFLIDSWEFQNKK